MKLIGEDLPHQATARIDAEFAAAVIFGFSQPQKELPPRFFYDRRGSRLFEAITDLPEYYPTRTELGILQRVATDLQSHADPCVLVELGSGSSRKTEILLDAIPELAAYVPIDVSSSALKDAQRRLERRYPQLAIIPVAGDFTAEIVLPEHLAACHKIGFFPGSTIGNFHPHEAGELLSRLRALLAPSGRLLIGVDLVKDVTTLERAYDDAAGVTAAFNLNILHRINRELGADIDVASFRHCAIWNDAEQRIEMHLQSSRNQTVTVLDRIFDLARGETIHTENSYKYTTQRFQEMAGAAGWTTARVWTDQQHWFSVHELCM